MNFEQARNNMVLNQLRANRIRDISLIEKIEIFPRENLYPIKYKHLSYSDQIINLDDGRFILPPLIIAFMFPFNSIILKSPTELNALTFPLD